MLKALNIILQELWTIMNCYLKKLQLFNADRCHRSRLLCLQLSPVHFFIDRPPDENVIDENVNRLSRFQLMQHEIQHF